MVKLFFKLFLSLGIPFGLFMGLMEGMSRGLEEGVRIGVSQGLFFGILMALFLGVLHRRECRRLGVEEDISPRQTMALEVTADSAGTVYARVKKAVESYGGKVIKENRETNSLRARIRASWKSFGEVLDCRVAEAGTHRYEIEIVSRPRFRGTVIDYGKGRQNVESVAQRLL